MLAQMQGSGQLCGLILECGAISGPPPTPTLNTANVLAEQSSCRLQTLGQGPAPPMLMTGAIPSHLRGQICWPGMSYARSWLSKKDPQEDAWPLNLFELSILLAATFVSKI